jgi:hypothetical protein
VTRGADPRTPAEAAKLARAVKLRMLLLLVVGLCLLAFGDLAMRLAGGLVAAAAVGFFVLRRA